MVIFQAFSVPYKQRLSSSHYIESNATYVRIVKHKFVYNGTFVKMRTKDKVIVTALDLYLKIILFSISPTIS